MMDIIAKAAEKFLLPILYAHLDDLLPGLLEKVKVEILEEVDKLFNNVPKPAPDQNPEPPK